MRPAATLLCLLLSLTSCSWTPEARKRNAFERGQELLKAGRYAEAAINFRKALQIDASFGDAYSGLAAADEKLGDLTNARVHLEAAERLLPANHEIKVRLAGLLLASYLSDPRRPQQVYSTLARLAGDLLRLDPRSFDGLRIQGQLALADKRIDDAISLFERAHRVRPFEDEVVVALVRALAIAGRHEDSERLARETIQRRPKFGPAYDALYLLFLDTKRPADAERVFVEKAANNPGQPSYTLQLANHYLRHGQRERMDATLESLLTGPKPPDDAPLLVGSFYATIGDLEQAKRVFELGTGHTPAVEQACQKRTAQILALQNRLDEARASIEAVLARNPGDTEAKTLSAAFRTGSRKPEEQAAALEELRELARSQPSDALVRSQLGRALFAQGLWNEALNEFQAITQRNQNHIPAWLFLAEIHLQKREYERTVQAANEALARSPNHAAARLLRAFGLMGLDRSRAARLELESLIETHPKLAAARLQLGILYVKEKKFQQADAIFRALHEPGAADSRPLEGLVLSQYAQGQLGDAVRLLTAEVSRSPANETARALLAVTALRAGDPGLALEHLRFLIERNPRSAEWRLREGFAHQRKGDLESAIDSYRQAAALAPRAPQPAAFLANALEAANRPSEAIAQYRAALALQPGNPLLLNNLAHLLAETGGNLEEALELARRAVREFPDHPALMDTLGWVSLKKGMPDTALATFHALCRKYPNEPLYRYHLGAALVAKGDSARARAELLEALNRRPAGPTEGSIKKLLASLQ